MEYETNSTKTKIWDSIQKVDNQLKEILDRDNVHYKEARKHLLMARMLYVHSLFFDEQKYGF